MGIMMPNTALCCCPLGVKGDRATTATAAFFAPYPDTHRVSAPLGRYRRSRGASSHYEVFLMHLPHPVGVIRDLWWYPVKSMLGISSDALALDRRGVIGDRWFAVRTAAGKFGSGKTTRRFQAIDGLFRFQARVQDAVPSIQFPSGVIMRADDPSIHHALTDVLGQSVMLVEEAAIRHLDAGPVHLVTTAALAWLQDALPATAIDARRFRPNIVLDVPGCDLVEHQWIGQRLRIGRTVELHVRALAERCGMVGFCQSALPQAPAILRHLVQHTGSMFGVYADVVVPGIIHADDPVLLVEALDGEGGAAGQIWSSR